LRDESVVVRLILVVRLAGARFVPVRRFPVAAFLQFVEVLDKCAPLEGGGSEWAPDASRIGTRDVTISRRWRRFVACSRTIARRLVTGSWPSTTSWTSFAPKSPRSLSS
jgi:hypothetical protein